MKHIKLECKTRGYGYGDIVPVGGKDGIPAKDAAELVASGLAKEYSAPVAGGGVDAKRLAELEGENAALTAKIAELEGENAALTAKIAELEAIIAAIGEGAKDGKDSKAK